MPSDFNNQRMFANGINTKTGKTVKEVISDNNFRQLPFEEKRKVLSNIDVNFPQLPLSEQNKVLIKIGGSSFNKAKETEQKPETSLTESLINTIKDPETIGSVVGGIGGSLLPIPGAPLTGGMAGAAIGGGIGSAIKGGTSKDIAMAAGTQAIGELAGAGIAKGASKILAPFAKKLLPEADVAIKTMEKYVPKKYPSLTPAQVTESRSLDLLENIAEGSIIGGQRIAKFKVVQKKAIDDMVDDIIKTYKGNASAQDIGNLFEKAVKGNLKGAKLVTAPMYNNVEQIAGNVPIPLNKLKNFSQPFLKTAKELNGIEAKNSGDDLISAIINLDDSISFSSAKELRSRLMSRIDEFSLTNKKAPAIGKAKQLIGILDDSISGSLEQNSPEAYTIWREANRLYRSGQEQFNNRFIRSLIKRADPEFGAEPEKIMSSIFKKNNVSAIEKVKTATNGTDAFDKLKGWFVQDLINRSTDSSGEISGKYLYNNLYGKSGIGKETLEKIFSENELSNLTKVATTIRLVQQKQGEGTGKMFIQLTQGTAMLGLATGTYPKAGSTILISPFILSRIITNPTLSNWLSIGYKLPYGSRGASIIGSKIMAGLVKDKLIQEAQNKKPQEDEKLKLSNNIFPNELQ